MFLFLLAFFICITGYLLLGVVLWPPGDPLPVSEAPAPIPQVRTPTMEELLQEQLHHAKMENVELLRKLSGSVYK